MNQKGIDHYVKFVDDLLEAGITPFVTLYHWDLPDELDKRYGGLLNKDEFSEDFAHYARILYKALPKVKHWITFNEPWCSCIIGYHFGVFAPGHTSNRSKSDVGDSTIEPWIVGHSILIAHAKAVKVYREEFKAQDKGEIGITLNGKSSSPTSNPDLIMPRRLGRPLGCRRPRRRQSLRPQNRIRHLLVRRPHLLRPLPTINDRTTRRSSPQIHG